MAQPWVYGPVQFDVTGGESSVVQLNVPHRGTITGIFLRTTTDGISGNFAIYSREDAANDAANDANGESASITGELPYEAYRIATGQLTSSAYEHNELHVGYTNADGTLIVPVQKLWLVLRPSGAGEQPFTLRMTIEGMTFR